jgi:hypothetical protein
VDRERLEQETVQEREDRGVRTDAEGERQNGDSGHERRGFERAIGIAKQHEGQPPALSLIRNSYQLSAVSYQLSVLLVHG